ncbi:MAG TPA: hypothetical protein VFW42_02600 [Fluviicoccus sp.]|nr:hypothetical protein [Fluviicoccus sp.]
MRLLFRLAGFSAALLFAGCNDGGLAGGGEGGETRSAVGVLMETTGPVINGVVAQGPVRNAVITASRWQPTGYAVVGSATTDASGNYSLPLPDSAPGFVRLDMALSADPEHPTEMLCVAVQCGDAVFGQWYPLSVNPRMSSWATVSGTGAVTTVPMTPFSTIAVRYAESIGGGPLGVNYARKRLSLLLGLSTSTLGTAPGNITDRAYLDAASASSLKWAMMVASFAELAQSQGVDLATVIDRYADAFRKNNGQLLQAPGADGSEPNLSSMILAALAVDSVARTRAGPSLSNWLSQQQSGQLNPLPPLAFDSEALLNALGPMGVDIRSVMQSEGAASLEALVAGQLSEVRWLASQETLAIASLSARTVVYSMLGSALLAKLPAGTSVTLVSGPLIVSLDTGSRVLTLIGVDSGMNVNLSIGLTALNAGSSTKPYVFTASGTVANGNVSASINGSLQINPTTTNLAPLLSAASGLFNSSPTAVQDLQAAIGGILQTGHGVFTISGSASMESVANPSSRLAVDGKASLNVDMAGGESGSIKAFGSVAYGTLTLPNGDYFNVTPGAGDFLRFALSGNDGSLSTQFSAYVMGLPQTVVKGSGKLTRLGSLLSGLRDTITGQLAAGQLDLSQILSQLTAFDYSSMELTVRGSANILGSYNHLYNLGIANGGLWISQPNSTAVAIRVTGGTNGAVVRAGDLSYVMGLDLANLNNPAVVVGDAVSGGFWRLDLASLMPPLPADTSSDGTGSSTTPPLLTMPVPPMP